MAKRWRIRPLDTGRVHDLARRADVPFVVAQLLVGRGVTDPAEVRQFLEAKLTSLYDPDDLPGVPEAAERLLAAIRDKRKIAVYGDYDVDGITGTALLSAALRLLGADCIYHVPNRLEDGYGLNAEALTRLHERGVHTIVTVDCGVTAVEEADLARRLGLELIITDHHTPGLQLPAADCLVHPGLPGRPYGFPQLCGAGVALKLAWSLCRLASGSAKVTDRMRDFLLQAVGMAALGTVADVVPLVSENRVLVRHGLTSLVAHPSVGIAALLDAAGLGDKKRLSGEDLAFTLAPRLNAAGRFGEARLAVELLETTNRERAADLARHLNDVNQARQTLEARLVKEARAQAEEQYDPVADPALVLADRGWHKGVIGIVAGRLAEIFHRPTIVVALDKLGQSPGTGSARSVPGLDLFAVLDGCRHHLVKCGGHAAAAGLMIAEESLPAFRAEFCERVAECWSETDRTAEIFIDGEAPLSAFSLKVLEQIEQMAPFGAGNPRPLWCCSGVKLASPPKTMGSSGRHCDFRFDHCGTVLRAVAFGRPEWIEEMNAVGTGTVDIAFRPEINEFRGRRNVELKLVDWRPSQPL
jgi:single-stranded-DNA-specific exonuclease